MKRKNLAASLAIALAMIGGLIGPAGTVAGQDAAGFEAGAMVRVLSSDAQGVMIEMTAPGVRLEPVQVEGETFDRVVMDGSALSRVPGEPQVPVRGTMLGVPSTEGLAVEVVEATGEDMAAPYRLQPAPREMAGPDDPATGLPAGVEEQPALDGSLYATDAPYPGALARLGQNGYLRDQAVAEVQFYPVQYNPARGELRVYSRIVVRLSWEAPGLRELDLGRPAPSAEFEKVLAGALLNYDSLGRSQPLAPVPSPTTVPAPESATAVSSVKINVTQDGMYRLTYAALVAAMPGLIGADPRTFKLKNRGVEVPIYIYGDQNNILDPGDEVWFYGTGLHDVYTYANVYWLSAGAGNGLRMPVVDGTPGTAGTPAGFPTTVHAEQDTAYWAAMPNSDGQDHWFWGARLSANTQGLDVSRTYQVDLGHRAPPAARTAAIRINLRGFTNTGHRTKVYLNGTQVADQAWSGQGAYTLTTAAAENLLVENNNNVLIEAANSGAAVDQWLVNWLEVDYRHSYAADSYGLSFGAPSAGTWKFAVTGLPAADAQAFDVTDPLGVKRITNAAVNGAAGNYSLTLQGTATAATRYLAVAGSQLKTPASIVADQPSAWRSAVNQADYIIVTDEALYANAQALATYRRGQGLTVVTVKLEDIFDEFNYGIYNPTAIRDFLSYAYHSWTPPAPTYVLLFGSGTYDYRDNRHFAKINHVPPMMIETTPLGDTPSDNWYAAVNGADILPDTFIGRLTAQDAAQATAMVNKIIYYEGHPPDATWNKNALLVADDDTPDFEAASDQLAGILPMSYAAHKVYVANYPPNSPTTDITNHINAGSLLVNYLGHGNVDMWGTWPGGHTFDLPNVAALANANKYPVVTVGDCLTGFFVQDSISTGEQFLGQSNSGAVGAWAPADVGYASGHGQLLTAFYRAIFRNDLYAVGSTAVAAEVNAYSQDSGLGETIQTFILFGDPAMKLGLPTNYPYLLSTTPANGAKAVQPDGTIRVQFGKPMIPGSVTLSVSGAPGVTFTPSWNADNSTVSYSHTSLPRGAAVTMTISGQDRLGNSLGPGAVPATWSFTVAASELYLPLLRR